MTDELSDAITAVKSYKYSLCKFVSRNDAGATGAHQAGLYIPKNSIRLLFDVPGVKGENKEDIGTIRWHNGQTAECRLKYYGTNTRNEYRITRLGRAFREGELVIIVKSGDAEYQGFLLQRQEDISAFLQEFGLSENDTNSLIDTGVVQSSETELPETDSTIFNEELPAEAAREGVENRELNFRPKAHILTLLGEELIKDPVMAIYELVKNSYDADSREVSVKFNHITDINRASIVILDHGLGMTEYVLENVWLEPGTAHRKPLDAEGKRTIVRSPVFNRVPMGEKGVGRFAVHKLGNCISLISRPAEIVYAPDGKILEIQLQDYEINLHIDWRSFTQSHYLSEVSIKWQKITDPTAFYFRDTHGTRIEISGLKETWTRGMARSLKRHTNSMVSPKNDPQKFSISLDFGNNWLDRLPDVNEIIAQAPYKLTAFVDRDYKLTFEYDFLLANNREIGERSIQGDLTFDRDIRAALRPYFREYFMEKGIDEEDIESVIEEHLREPVPFGEILLELYSYDLDAASLRDITYAPDVLRKTLREQHGIKVFKDDLRVYDYGEAGNDWLGLDIKRVQNKDWFSNNQNIGFIYLDSETSGSLVEKTNREGFIRNYSFDFFRIVIEFILNEFRIERQKDRIKWVNFNKRSPAKPTLHERVINFIELINDAGISNEDKKQQILDEATRIETDYEKTKETLLIPAGVGMTASVALHEIEKLVPRMQETVNTVPHNSERIKSQVEELDGYVQGILTVLKKAASGPVSVREAVDAALSNYELKFRRRSILPEIVIEDNVDTVMCDKRFLVTMLINLIENSIYWLDTVNRDQKKILFYGWKENNVTHLLVADNGPGFRATPEQIVTPFFTGRDGGIGIGMYLVDTVMMKYGKLKIYTDNTDAPVDSFETGAIIELIFNKNQS